MKKRTEVRSGSRRKKTRIRNPAVAELETYVLRLFIAGILPNSSRAIENINKICEAHLKDRFDLEIIDIYQQPALAFQEDIVALPILIKKLPLPEERLIGDLSNTKEVLEGLRLPN